MSSVSTLKRQIVNACKILDAKGLTEAFGHVTARHPDREAILITSIAGMGLITDDEDILTVNMEGEVLEGDPDLRPIEVFLHLSIYQARPEVRAISRTHGPHVTAFGAAEKPLEPVHGFGSFLGETVPVHPESQLIESPDLGDAVVRTLEDHEAVMLRGNGELAVGESVPRACVKSLYMEESARLQLRARALGEPRVFRPAERERRVKHAPAEFDRAWEFYCRKWTDS